MNNQLDLKMLLDQFVDYLDKVISDWFNGIIDGEQKAYKNLINQSYMPEPYIGNPKNCSFVVVNYNAGAGDNRDSHNYLPCAGCTIDRQRLICYVKDNSYSAFEVPFPCLMTDEELEQRNWTWIKSYGGYLWWQRRKEWIQNVTRAAGVPSINDGVMPFAIELCGWHTPSWSNTRVIIDDPTLHQVVEKRVINVIKAAIDCSTAKFAYFIGKKHIPLLESYGFKWRGGDQPNDMVSKHDNRFFAIYKHPQTCHRALVTWTIGSNTHPGKRFFEKEASMIKALTQL